MKAALRWVVIFGVGIAAAPYGARAASPMSNGVGDGEANVPFAAPTTGAEEGGRGIRADRPRDLGERGKVAGRSGHAAGRRAPTASGAEAAPRDDAAAPEAGGDRAFEQLIWTAP